MKVACKAPMLTCVIGVVMGITACTTTDDPEADANGNRHDATVDAVAPDASLTDAALPDGTLGDAGEDGGVTSLPAVLTVEGDPSKVLLQGTVLTPTQSFAGEVLIEGDIVTCVAASCSSEPGAATASVVQTNGIILPGLINTNSHVSYRIFDETDWTPSQQYTNHNQWTSEERYGALLDAKQYLNGEGGSPINLGCELNKYGEIQALISGTTSVVGKSIPGNRGCYRTLARTIDQTANGLCAASPAQGCGDFVQTHTLMPSTTSADAVCTNFFEGGTHAYFVQLAEGTDQNAANEWDSLRLVTTVDGCLFRAGTTLVHAVALGAPELTEMATSGLGLSWSPSSNVTLYGGGTDLTQTADIPQAVAAGVTVSLSTGFPPVASSSLLDELRFADGVDNTEWGDLLTPQMLLEMVTLNAAEQLALEGAIGRLAVGLKADVLVIGGDATTPYEAVLAATPRDVRLVMVNGTTLYGDVQLQPLGPATPGCETMTTCGASKFICVAVDGQPAMYLFEQTLADIESNLSAALLAYDNLDLSQWDFHPLAPLAQCP
jgi:5-methylthioadenosine/S-adenosylhomocysteine deaminase